MTETSKEYGEALFALACEEGCREEYGEALQTVSACFAENPAYAELLSSPGIPMRERLDAIGQAFSGALPEHVVSFLQLLCEKGHIGCLSACVAEYNRLLSASRGISHARVTSAVALTPTEQKKLQAKLEGMCGHTVVAEYKIDPSLLGGVVIESDGKILDGSLRRRLHEVKDVMNK